MTCIYSIRHALTSLISVRGKMPFVRRFNFGSWQNATRLPARFPFVAKRHLSVSSFSTRGGSASKSFSWYNRFDGRESCTRNFFSGKIRKIMDDLFDNTKSQKQPLAAQMTKRKCLRSFSFLRVFNPKNSGVRFAFLASAIRGANAGKYFSCFSNFEAR